MPTGRQKLALAAGGDGKIYAIGGESVIGPQSGPFPTRKVLRAVEAYDPTTGTWTREPDLPGPRTGLAAATGRDGRIFVLGGTAGEGTATNPPESLASVAIFDPKTHRWSAGTPLPDGRSQLAAVTGTDGRIYAIGGLSNERAVTVCEPVGTAPSGSVPPGQAPCSGPNTAVAYNPKTGTWTHLADLHAERLGAAAAAGRDGRIYVFGGSDRQTGLFLTSAEVYDPRTNRWSPIAPMPHVRQMGFAAATAKDGRIYLIGGCVGPPGNHGCTTAPPSPVDVYDPAHNTWKTIGSTVYSSAGAATATGPDGRIYVAGGVGDGNGHLLQVLSP
jgi:N-acetylneuraminic acid mutarotase